MSSEKKSVLYIAKYCKKITSKNAIYGQDIEPDDNEFNTNVDTLHVPRTMK